MSAAYVQFTELVTCTAQPLCQHLLQSRQGATLMSMSVLGILKQSLTLKQGQS